jgi:hypothetical protein
MVFMGMASEMDPNEWGRKQERDELIPIMADKNTAPDELLQVF